MRILLLCLIVMVSERATAYPQMIQLGYHSCLSCHYNPHGGGPLTDYGRAVSATALMDRNIFAKNLSEEEVAERSTFLGRPTTPEWLRPSLSYRELYLQTRTPASIDERFIRMDLSATLVLKPYEDDRLIAVGTIAYAPRPRALKGTKDEVKPYRSREHYIGYRMRPDWGVYAGLMDKVYGLRVPDHTAFSRVYPQVTMNDQTHGVVVHGMTKEWEVGLQGFVGNLVQDSSLRQQGVTGQVERTVGKNARLGVSALRSKSRYLAVEAQGLHTRLGIGDAGSFLVEAGRTRKRAIETDFDVRSHYIFAQGFWLLRSGLFTLFTVDYAKPDERTAIVNHRFGPGLQYFHFPGIELRADLHSIATYDGSKVVSKASQLLA